MPCLCIRSHFGSLAQDPLALQSLGVHTDPWNMEGSWQMVTVDPVEYADSEAPTEPARESIGEAWMDLHDHLLPGLRAPEGHQDETEPSEASASTGGPDTTFWTPAVPGDPCVRCNVCMQWMRIDDPLGIYGPNAEEKIKQEHLGSPKHRNKLKAIKEQEEREHMEAINEERIQEKVQLIIATIEDHPMYLDNQWVPLGNFLKISKMDLANRSSTTWEFLVAGQTDESEVIFEIMEWLEEDC